LHELALMQGVMDAVRDSAAANSISKVSKVGLVVGKLSMVLPDSMLFAFEVISAGEDLFQGAVLEIEEKEVICSCQQCQQLFTRQEQHIFVCSGCGSNQVDIIQGRELYLDYYEGD
jgi:hydrogenase nickel incorporation protein HypA/HybF